VIRYRLRAAACAAAAALCVSCNPRARVERARHTAEEFHRQYNAQNYRAMFQLAGPVVQRSSSEKVFAEYESGVRAKLGELKTAELGNYNLLYLLGGPQVRLDYKCKFERGDGLESFEINFSGEKALINGYRLDSPQLDNKRSKH
jgi:hypothetical protein